MANLILPAGFAEQPRFPAPINSANPLASGLVVATYGAGTKNYAGSDSFDAFNAPKPDAFTSGRNIRFVQASSQYLKKNSQGISGFPFTVVQIINRNNVGEATGYFCLGAASGGDRFLVYSASNAQFTLFASTGGGSTSTTISSAMVANTDYVIGAVVGSATDRRVYLNGRQEASSAVSRAPGTLSVMTIGSDWSSGAAGIFHNGTVALTLVWNRALSDVEMAALYKPQNGGPWQVFQMPPRRFWAVNTVAGPTITSVSTATPREGASLTITGTNFGASQGAGTVKINGVAQTVTSWGDTSIVVTAVLGTNKFGAAYTVVVRDNGGTDSNSYAGITGLLPVSSARSYVDITTPNATATYRIQATPDIAAGGQVEYDNNGGSTVVNADGTFSSLIDFYARAWVTVDGYGARALQSFRVQNGGNASFGRVFKRFSKMFRRF